MRLGFDEELSGAQDACFTLLCSRAMGGSVEALPVLDDESWSLGESMAAETISALRGQLLARDVSPLGAAT